MEDRQHVIVRVAPDGTVSAETVGIKGPKCLDYINVLEDLLEAETVESRFTSDYYESVRTAQYEVRHDVEQR